MVHLLKWRHLLTCNTMITMDQRFQTCSETLDSSERTDDLNLQKKRQRKSLTMHWLLFLPQCSYACFLPLTGDPACIFFWIRAQDATVHGQILLKQLEDAHYQQENSIEEKQATFSFASSASGITHGHCVYLAPPMQLLHSVVMLQSGLCCPPAHSLAVYSSRSWIFMSSVWICSCHVVYFMINVKVESWFSTF